jgi:hypothetical protein
MNVVKKRIKKAFKMLKKKQRRGIDPPRRKKTGQSNVSPRLAAGDTTRG